MARLTAVAKVFAGRWRIVEMDTQDSDVLDPASQTPLASLITTTTKSPRAGCVSSRSSRRSLSSAAC